MESGVEKEFLKGHLPILVLGLLQQEPRHGYALCQALAGTGGGRLELGEGTIYPLLHRLERQGHIQAEWKSGETGKPRKVYSITATGRGLIQEHQSDWQELGRLFSAVFGKEWTSA